MNIVIQTGLHKTGTTFLQKGVIKNIPHINYIRPFHLLAPFYDDKINFIAEEVFSGKPFSVCKNYDMRPYITERLQRMFPEAKIIVGVREINSWLKSGYKHSVIRGNFISYDQWIKRINHDYWDMNSYVSLLKSKFNHVFVYKFEDLKDDCENIVDDLCSFIGVDTPHYENKRYNISLKPYQVEAMKVVNRFLYSEHYNPDKKIPQHPFSELVHSIHNKRNG